MKRTRMPRVARALAIALAGLALAACAGLPTTGEVQLGQPLGQAPDDPDFLPYASGPIDGAGPEAIVEGFLQAAVTPDDGWAIARRFLTPEFAAKWRPGNGVAIDDDAVSRTVTSSVDDQKAEKATEADVQVQVKQVGSVDKKGVYSELSVTSSLPFKVERTDEGWRIASAPEGIVIDDSWFPQVFEGYELQYFDQTWTRMVPDVRWFPRRSAALATTVAQALFGGSPSPWLAPAVNNAFPKDVLLAREAVPIEDGVAEVALNRAAGQLDTQTLSRMRTQFEESLAAVGVQVDEARFSVDGRVVQTGVVQLTEPPEETGPIVLSADAFGVLEGEEVAPIPGLSADVLGFPLQISAIDVAADLSFAAVQGADGHVYWVGDGKVNDIDPRAGLLKPAIDLYGYTWTVPSGEPAALRVSGRDASPHGVTGAWPSATSISRLRISPDGARAAAVAVVDGQQSIVVAAVVRDSSGMPVELGAPRILGRLSSPAAGLVWLEPDQLGILTDMENPTLVTQTVGGMASGEGAPSGAVAVAGSRSGARVLTADGVLFTRGDTTWRQSASGIRVLATRAGH